MGRKPCCDKEGIKRGAWSVTEDEILMNYIQVHGEGKWNDVSRLAGLNRPGKSCRLRWLNYLRPDIKRGNISEDEEELIIRLHKLLGNRWSLIAGRLPGRTDNEIKNFWNNNLSKRVEQKDSQNKPANPTRTRDPSPSTSMNEKISLLATDPVSVSSQSHTVVQAKGMRCTEKIIMPEIRKLNAADWETQSGSGTTSASSTVQDDNEYLRFFSHGFLEDFDIDDLLIPEVNESQYCENLQVSQEGIQNGFIADVGVVANDVVICAVNDDSANPQNWMVHNFFEPNHNEDIDFSLLNLDHV